MPTPNQNYNWFFDALARGGVPKNVLQTITNPGKLSTDAIGQFNRIVNNTGNSFQTTARNLTGAVQQAVAQSTGVKPSNPITGFRFSGTNPLGRGVTAPTIGTGTPRSPVIGPTITGPAPNTFGAPYIRDPALTRQFMGGGLPRNVGSLGLTSVLSPVGTALTFGPIMGEAGIQFGKYLRTPQGEQLKENFANPVRFLQQQYQNMINPPVRLEQFDADVSIEEHIKNTKKGSLDPAPVTPVTPVTSVTPVTPVLLPEIPNFLQSRAPVVVTTPQSPGQAIGNMAGTDLYNVARQAAAQQGTQQDLDAVTDLGLAQWRANFPGLAGSPLSPEALQRDAQQEELAIKSQDFMEKYRKLMEANRK